jgi:Retrotransposon gag protein
MILDRLNPLVDNIPEVWEHFCDEFTEQFLDTTEQETARTDLQKLRMEPGKIDQYISKFEELARHANYTVGNEETARLFLEGLTIQVMQDVLTTDGLHGYIDYKRRAVDANKN